MANSKKGKLAPRLVLVGDVAVEFKDPKKMMAKLAPYTQGSAIAFCNCEWPLTTKGTPWAGKAGRVVRSSPDKLPMYTFPGFNVVTLANNHIMNFGAEGLMETIEVLDSAGIAHCGAGKNLAEAHKPAIVEWNGTKIAFLGYSCVFTAGFEARANRAGMAVVRTDVTYRAPSRMHEVPGLPMTTKTSPRADDAAMMVDDIKKAAKKADAVVATFHWGISGGYQHLVGYQKELAHMCIDAGADLVVGHHPHTIQPVEVYKDKVIAYSLSHCGFDMESDSHSDESLLVEVPLTKSGFGRPLVKPVGNAVHRPELMTFDQGRSCMEWVARMSQPLGTSWKVKGDAAEPVAKGGLTSFV
jgi:poly-gamma-glutamate capsule biosynthesis protein CapA/YwtB (metallophosphatase superfamily)